MCQRLKFRKTKLFGEGVDSCVLEQLCAGVVDSWETWIGLETIGDGR